MNFAFHEEAEKEFLEAIEFYETAELGVGEDFLWKFSLRSGASPLTRISGPSSKVTCAAASLTDFPLACCMPWSQVNFTFSL